MVPACGLVTGPVGDPVGDPVGGPVGGPVCGLVDGPVCGAVRAVCGPVGTRPAPYNGLPASNAWIVVGKRACVLMFPNSVRQLGVLYNDTKEPVCDRPCRGFGVSHGPVLRCGGVAVVLRWCCGVAVLCSVAEGLRWCCGGVTVARSVVPVDGPVGWSQSVRLMVRSGRLSGQWSGPWSSSGPSPWSGRWYGPVVWPVVRFVVWSFVVRSVQSVVRQNTSCSIQWLASFKRLGPGRASGLVFFCVVPQ